MVFDRPEQFNPDRFRERTYGRKEYSAFGGNLRHACLGEGLTMMMGRLLVEELSTGFDWHTTADGEYEYGPWRHWRPSSDWRVQVEVGRTSVTGADRHRETAAAR
jgi:cytochrome P450